MLIIAPSQRLVVEAGIEPAPFSPSRRLLAEPYSVEQAASFAGNADASPNVGCTTMNSSLYPPLNAVSLQPPASPRQRPEDGAGGVRDVMAAFLKLHLEPVTFDEFQRP